MKRSSAAYIFIIALIIIAAYRQVFFLQHPLLWDTPECFFPYRFFMSECLRHGYVPLWDPYQFTGYPFFADPQSGCWYPPMWLLSAFGRYSLAFSNIEYVLSIFIGACGMYSLAHGWTKDKESALLAGISYACCGVFVSNAEHLSWIIAIAWLPWLFWSYHQMCQTYRYKYTGLFAIFLFMMASGGYPAFLFISFYLILILFAVLLYNKRKDSVIIKKILRLHVALFILSAGCCLVVFYSYIYTMLVSTRGSGTTLEVALFYPFTPQSFLSLLLPFASFNNTDLYSTDPSMSNGYFGILSVAFLMMAITGRKSRRSWLILILSLLCLGTALGGALPFRTLLYKWVPLMNLFRYPACFRIFFIIGSLLLAAETFKETRDNFVQRRKQLIAITVLLLICLLGAAVYAYARVKGLTHDWKELLLQYDNFGKHNFHTHILVQSLIQLGILSAFLLLLFIIPKSRLNLNIILLLCAVDMISSVQKNMFGTIVNRDVRLGEINKKIKDAPAGFPLPDNTVPIINHSDNNYKEELSPVVRNTLPIKKLLGFDGYNPFQTKRFNAIDNSNVHDSIWANPPAYFANNVLPIRYGEPLPLKNDVYMDTGSYNAVHSLFYPALETDSITFSAFSPNKMTLHTNASGPRLVILQQNNVRGWHSEIDGKEMKWYKCNIAYMAVPVPAGSHYVTFHFMPPYLLLFAIGSLAFLLASVAVVISGSVKVPISISSLL